MCFQLKYVTQLLKTIFAFNSSLKYIHYTPFRNTNISRILRALQWLANCALKPRVTCSSPVAGYVQRWALCSNRPANVYVSVKRVEVVEKS